MVKSRTTPKYFICIQCGIKFPNYNFKKERKFCSLSCYYKSPNFKEAVKNGGKSHKGRKICWGDKISKAKLGTKRPDMAGNKNWNWKGGITPRDLTSFEYKMWRKKVFERDNYTCQKCGNRNYQDKGKTTFLVAHHIKEWSEYPKLRFDVKNGLTVCNKCHNYIHGRIIEYQDEFFTINSLAEYLGKSRQFVYDRI